MTLGDHAHAINLSLHGSYAPGMSTTTSFERGTQTLQVTRDGLWRYGVSLGFYVPFFDLN